MNFKLSLVSLLLVWVALELYWCLTQPAFISPITATIVGNVTINDVNSNSSQQVQPLEERQGRILGILGNWGYGYPGFGGGAYGRLLCRRGRPHRHKKYMPGIDGSSGRSSMFF